MIESIQTYATLIGLLLDIAGVVLLAREFIESAIGGTRRLFSFQRTLNLSHAAKAKVAREQAAVARAQGANWFTMMGHEIGLALRRADAQMYAEQVKKTRLEVDLPALSVLDADGYVNVDALHVHGAEIDEYYRDLGETGTIRPGISRLAFGLIVGGFILQFIGALPLS